MFKNPSFSTYYIYTLPAHKQLSILWSYTYPSPANIVIKLINVYN